MVFQSVRKVTGEYFTQVDQNQMDDNDLYNRGRTDMIHVAYASSYMSTRGSAMPSNTVVTVYVDGAAKGMFTLVGGVGDFQITDIDLSGYSPGLHDIKIDTSTGSPPVVKWIKSADNDLLSVWGKVSQVKTDSYTDELGQLVETWEVTYTNLGVISHRVSQGW